MNKFGSGAMEELYGEMVDCIKYEAIFDNYKMLHLCAKAVAEECGLNINVLRKLEFTSYAPLGNLADLLMEETNEK